MKQHYVMPVGVDDFRRVREEYYYVDKTDFIRQLIDGHAQATLITRPRRFGKTLSLSMLYYFFTNKEAEANRVLFRGQQHRKSRGAVYGRARLSASGVPEPKGYQAVRYG